MMSKSRNSSTLLDFDYTPRDIVNSTIYCRWRDEMEKERLFNYQVDFINGNIFSSLVLFAVPIFISNIFQQLYNTADVMVVGNVLGDTSLAAVGSTTAIYDLLLGVCLAIVSSLSI